MIPGDTQLCQRAIVLPQFFQRCRNIHQHGSFIYFVSGVFDDCEKFNNRYSRLPSSRNSQAFKKR
jgi:hypothetical protein